MYNSKPNIILEQSSVSREQCLMDPMSFDRWLWKSGKPAPEISDARIMETEKCQVRLRDTAVIGGDEYTRPAIIFLCDPPVMVEHYDEIIERFANDCRVIVVELPGFGFSRPLSNDALLFRNAVEAVESALKQLNITDAVICGPCICGFVATELFRRNCLPVRGLVLVQTPDLEGMVAWTKRMDPKGGLRKPYMGQLMMRMMGRKVSRFWFRYASGKQANHHSMTGITTQVLKAGGSYPLATVLQYWTDGPVDGPLKVPAMVVWGQQDRSHATTDRRSTCAHVPDANIIEFEHCGHFPELEDPSLFYQTVKPFLIKCFDQNGVPE